MGRYGCFSPIPPRTLARLATPVTITAAAESDLHFSRCFESMAGLSAT